jgi:hypothetical protein
VTLGELFKSQGYATAITGKWHLGASEQSWPTRQGFDEYRVGVLASTAEGTGLRSSNGGGSMVMITMALRSRCRHQPMSAAATNIAAGPIPPGRRGTGLRQKDHGVGLTARRDGSRRCRENADPQIGKILAYTPPAAEERDSGEGRRWHRRRLRRISHFDAVRHRLRAPSCK